MASEDEPKAEVDDLRYTPEQVSELVDGMSDADANAVAMASRHFAARAGMEAEDLQQEAFVRALESRSCRVGVDIVAFICGIMKSIASDMPRARKKARQRAEARGEPVRPIGVEIAFVADYEALGGLVADALSPEDEALSTVFHSRELDRAMACIADDDDLHLLVEGMYDGMTGKALEELLSTDTKGLAAIRKRLGRRVTARFPAGAPL
jgi:DNA-directed RNA polymerase specialized sigma24 family protein